jgi:Uri superfamily endonuclease
VSIHSSGTYCLVISTGQDLEKTIGTLGKIRFKPGLYLYIGSALKSMDKRISRHQRRKKKVFWHIDRLTSDGRFFIEKVYTIGGPKKLECKTAKKLAGIFTGVTGFGSSDCRCGSHLFFAGSKKTIQGIVDVLTGEMGFKNYQSKARGRTSA